LLGIIYFMNCQYILNKYQEYKLKFTNHCCF